MFDRSRLNQMLMDLNERIQGAVMEGGRRLNKMDVAYANRLDNSIADAETHPIRHMTMAAPIKQLINEPVMADSQIERLLGEAFKAGAITSNVATRYALPAGGVTLAGKALYDLGVAIGSQGQE